jgi:threonine dehydrogenase-like Zn-dependent dehydrogenase
VRAEPAVSSLIAGRLRRRGPRRFGVAHGVAIDGMDLFWSLAHVHGGPEPVRRFLPQLIDLTWNRKIDPGKVFDLHLPLDQAADGYRAMDQRDAVKVLRRP